MEDELERRLNLDDIVPIDDDPSDQPDERARKYSDYYPSQRQYVSELRKHHLDSLRGDYRQRVTFAKSVFVLTIAWLFFVLATVWCDAIRFVPLVRPVSTFIVPENVLIALVGTTTANILGVLLIVMKYVFRESASDIKLVSEARLSS